MHLEVVRGSIPDPTHWQLDPNSLEAKRASDHLSPACDLIHIRVRAMVYVPVVGEFEHLALSDPVPWDDHNKEEVLREVEEHCLGGRTYTLDLIGRQHLTPGPKPFEKQSFSRPMRTDNSRRLDFGQYAREPCRFSWTTNDVFKCSSKPIWEWISLCDDPIKVESIEHHLDCNRRVL